MKVIIQIPCYNEAQTLAKVLADIPAEMPGVSSIETLVIDDGSLDGTGNLALELGVDNLIRNTSNLGLAHSFRRGLDACLAAGADVIVNMDGDNQYSGAEIPKLIEPILAGRADMVIGDRQIDSIAHFPPYKKFLQKLGSFVVGLLSKTSIPDATSGFRAISRAAALKITILSNYTYTLESILQTQSKGLTVCSVPVTANPPTRESRLISSIRSYLAFSAATIIRIFTMYNPLKVFVDLGSVVALAGMLIMSRFLYYYLMGDSSGKIQSLILAAVLVITGATIMLVGILADLIQFNRRLLEEILERVRKLEIKEHYKDKPPQTGTKKTTASS